jgi:hypothetical protein
MPAVFASVSTSARTEGISRTFLPRGLCGTHCFSLSGSAFLWSAALANEYTGTALQLGPSCRRPAVHPKQ